APGRVAIDQGDIGSAATQLPRDAHADDAGADHDDAVARIHRERSFRGAAPALNPESITTVQEYGSLAVARSAGMTRPCFRCSITLPKLVNRARCRHSGSPCASARSPP